MSRVCLICGAALEQPATGRPPTYCGEPCKRAAGYEIRRVNAQIDDLERYQRSLRLMGTEERQQARIDAELRRLTDRLRALLDGQPARLSAQE